MSRTPPLLEAIGLRRVTDDGTVLLNDVSFSVLAGSSTAIVGPPGSGKTLLLRALSLLDALQSGEVQFLGRQVEDSDVPDFRRQVMLIPQRPSLIEGTVRDNLLLPFTFGTYTGRHFDEQRILNLLSHWERDLSILSREVRDLSGGESQIVALLRALQLDPLVMLLDEPTSSLDAQTTGVVEKLLTDWRTAADQRSLVVVTHTIEQASRLAGRTVHMKNGSIVLEEEHASQPS